MSPTKADELQLQFESIFSSAYPSFVYIQDISGTDVARGAIASALGPDAESPAVAFVDCTSCFSQRLLFDTILNALMRARHGSGMARNDSMDDFLHNLRELFRGGSSTKQTKIVVVFDHVEKLKETMPRLVHPLSRLQELVRHQFAALSIVMLNICLRQRWI